LNELSISQALKFTEESPPERESASMSETYNSQIESNSLLDDLALEALDNNDQKSRMESRAGVFIADDHPIFRDGLRRLIESQPEMFISGESAVGPGIVELARESKSDVVLLDMGLPGGSALPILSDLARLPAPARTLVMADTLDESTVLEAFYLGAQGVVLKGSPRRTLLKSIRTVLAGQYWLDHAGLPVVIQALRGFSTLRTGSARTMVYNLTPRELKIVGRVANGSSNKEVGQEFSISERTVKHHLTNIFSKLHLSGRVELAVFAFEHGLVAR
jgi:two-component system nitrate/nitrite response regulator NarL